MEQTHAQEMEDDAGSRTGRRRMRLAGAALGPVPLFVGAWGLVAVMAVAVLAIVHALQ